MAKNGVPAKRDKNEVAKPMDYEEFSGRGFQNQTQEDLALPMINLLQSNSPEVDKKDEKYVEGAEAGMFINSVTKELYTEIEMVPAITRHRFIEWVPRKLGGGLVGFHPIGSDAVKAAKDASTKFGKYKHGENDLVETFEIFGILSIDGKPAGMAVVPFASTKIKSYKHIMGRLNSFQLGLDKKGNVAEDDALIVRRVSPPLFAHTIKISSIGDKNAEGSFYKTVVKPAVENDVKKSIVGTDDPRFKLAAECERLVNAGRADADYSSQNRTEEDEELPF